LACFNRWLRHRLANQVKTRLQILLRVLTLCFGSATAFDGALAQSHGSDLLSLRLLFAHRPAVSFLTSPAFRKVFTGLAWTSCPSQLERSFCSAFQRFSFGWLRVFATAARVVRSVLDTVAILYPLGNCDSLRFETSLNYLTRFGTVSNRSSLLSPFFAFTDGARTPPEELVNSASPFEPFDPLSEEPSQPAWLNFSPVTWDYP
jgi:hypothetical protein